MKSTFAPCSREDGKNCLMQRFDGKCVALSDTENCTFFKDKTKMSEEEILEYDLLWADEKGERE